MAIRTAEVGQAPWERHVLSPHVLVSEALLAARKPQQVIREEMGSWSPLVTVSKLLRDADPSAARHYVDLKRRPTIEIGSWVESTQTQCSKLRRKA